MSSLHLVHEHFVVIDPRLLAGRFALPLRDNFIEEIYKLKAIICLFLAFLSDR